jgi:hypothetical protein
MIEGKALHNAQVADLDTKKVDSYVNKGLKLVTGLLDSTHLRCDLGILPAELVMHRNAMYYIWHLRRRAWFRRYLPSLAHLQPIKRLTSMVLYYQDLQLRDVDRLQYEQWRRVVKKAVLERATTFYNTADYSDYALFPQAAYSFQYLGQDYLTNLHTTNLAQTAIELRHDRLRGVPSPWEHRPCIYCDQPHSLHGRHLLQCPRLPDNLLEQRTQLIEGSYPELCLSRFAEATVACVGAQEKYESSPLLVFLRKSHALGRKIMRHARKAVWIALEADAEDESLSALLQLFEEVPEEQELVDASAPLCSLQSSFPFAAAADAALDLGIDLGIAA